MLIRLHNVSDQSVREKEIDVKKDETENSAISRCYPVVTLGKQPFGTSHWAGTWNGFPAVSLAYFGGATLFYFDQEWKGIKFPGLAALHEFLGLCG